jgi:hypothetical protein
MTTQYSTYLLLISSNIKRNNQIKTGKNIKIINNSIRFVDIFDRLTTEKEVKFTKYNHLQIISKKFNNSFNESEATDKIIEGNNNQYSNYLALPLRSKLSTESAAINLQGKLIPMTCSCLSRPERN